MSFFSKSRYRKKLRKVPNYFLLIIVLIIGFIGVQFGIASQAADDEYWIEIGKDKLNQGGEIIMTDSSMFMQLKKSGKQYASDNYIVHWEILLDGSDVIGYYDDEYSNSKVREIKASKEGAYTCGIKAKKSGKAQMMVYIKDETDKSIDATVSGGAAGGASIKIFTFTINVELNIDTYEFGEDYTKVFAKDTEGSLVMDKSERKIIKFNVEDTKEIQCYSEDKDVVDIEQEVTSGGTIYYAVAKGCGTTEIQVRDRNSSDSVRVYVMPKVYDIKNGKFTRQLSVSLESGESLISNACFAMDESKVLQDKMVWVISKYNDKNQPIVIEDSLGTVNSDLIDIRRENVSTPSNLRVTATAGQYLVELYPIGMYKSEKEKTDIVPTTIKINVCANLRSRNVNLMIGDEFSVADAINITVDDFMTWFDVVYPSSEETGGGFGADCALSHMDNQGIFRANSTTDAKSDAKYTVKFVAKTQYQEKVRDLMSTSLKLEYKDQDIPQISFTFRVIDDLLLNMQSVSLVVGEETTLFPTRQIETYDGEDYVWTSSDPKSVSVSDLGTIKGLKRTEDDVIITVSLKLVDGTIKKATCRVKVIETIKNIKLSQTELDLLEGNVKTITATFNPDRTEVPIQWLTSNEEVFGINVSTDKKSVVVTAKKAGTAVLTAINEDNYVTAVCKITVLAQITKISLPAAQLNVKLNQEVVRLTANCTPKNSKDNELVWDSSDKNVATVDGSGLVTLKKAGSTIITVKPLYNTSPPIMAQCIVSVEQSSSGISLDKSSVTLEKGETAILNTILKPTNATTTIAWKSMDTGVATISPQGMVTAKKAGTTYIVATSADGYSANCKIVVTQQAEGIKLSVTKLSLGVGNSYTVGTTITPAEATDRSITWSSQDNSIAKVTTDGKITGVAVGSTVVAAKIKSGQVAYITVNVTDTVKGISLDQEKKTILVGKSFLLSPVFKPANATNQKVSWTTSDAKIATVNELGKVTGVKGGTAMITCTSDEGKFTANCVVTVKELVTNVKLNKTSVKMTVGATTKLVATVSSETASNKKVTWTTSNKKIATVNQSGKVTAKKLGTCKITAKAVDGSGESATCTIRIIKKVSSLKINHSYLKLMEGKSAKIKSVVSPSNATVKTVKWKSSDTNIAMVSSNGKVTALSAGIAKITVSTTDGSKLVATCTVQVIKAAPVTSLTVSSKDITMVRGTSQSASVSISPTNTTDKITYASDNKAVATVNSKGKITAKKPGIATITVSSTSGKQVCINVMVVGLNKTSMRLQQYDSDELWVEEVSDNVKWSSSNPEIVRVNNGSVVARKVGTAVITATVRGVKLRCNVQVVKIEK